MDVILPAECKNFGITEKIVIYLALPLLDSGRTVFMDNWYSSCLLYDYLHYRQTMACGTIIDLSKYVLLCWFIRDQQMSKNNYATNNKPQKLRYFYQYGAAPGFLGLRRLKG